MLATPSSPASLMSMLAVCLALTPPPSAVAATSGAFNENWPQWRGPLANGVAPRAHPPLKWSETENVRWKVQVPGSGTATPIIWENRVFLLSAIPAAPNPASPAAGEPSKPDTSKQTQQFVVLCLDRKTGRTLWQKVAREVVPHEGHHKDHGFASASPVTDGKVLVASFGSRGLYGYDLEGNLQWSKDLGVMKTRNGFGEAATPVLSGGKVILNWDHEGADFIAAFDANTGGELWRSEHEEATNWTTPLVVEHAGTTQVIVNGTQRVRSYDLASGKLLWECAGQTANAIPSPVAADGIAYLTSGFRGSSLQAIRLGRSGNLTGTDAIAWSHNKNTPYVPSPLLFDDHLYFFGGNNNLLSCFEAKTGRPLIDAERVTGLGGVYASPVGAGDRVYLLGRDGTTVVVKKGPKLEILATNKLDDLTDASIALVGSDLFIRGHENLYCLGEK